jgi:hypothetical protein
MLAHPVVAAVSDRRRRSEIDATIYVPPYRNPIPIKPKPAPVDRSAAWRLQSPATAAAQFFNSDLPKPLPRLTLLRILVHLKHHNRGCTKSNQGKP